MAYVCSFSGAVAGFSPSPERRIKGHECISLVANILHTLLSDLNYLPSVGEQIRRGGMSSVSSAAAAAFTSVLVARSVTYLISSHKLESSS